MNSKFFILPICFLLLQIACKEDNGPTIPSDCSTTEGTTDQSNNSEIEAMRQAMLTFKNSLSEELRNQATTCLDSDRFVTWHNTPPAVTDRDGITYGDLNATQLNHFKSMLQLFLSSEGYQKVDEITVLAEGFLNNIDPSFWTTNDYSIDTFGDPENSGSWGFQLDGHHCAINFLVHGDNVSIVPAFLAAEPVKENFNGIAFDIFKDERDLALALYNGLTIAENQAAVSTGNTDVMQVGPGNNGRNPDPNRGDYDYSGFATGLKYSDMTPETQANLVLLMQEYVYNLNNTFADIWWADVVANIEDSYFVWLDEVDTPTAFTQFYYRIYNPYLWVEYTMEPPVGDGIDEWNHIHTITRIPNNPMTNNGGDYGLFAQRINQGGPKTLYEHFISEAHHRHSKLLFDYQINIPHIHQRGHYHHG